MKSSSSSSSSSNSLIINASLASQQDSKTLLKLLLNVVKDCQTHYGGKTELATEHDLRIANLCLVWEATFLHGLINRTTTTVTSASLSVLKNVTDMMTNGIGSSASAAAAAATAASESISFWPFVYDALLTGHEKERFSTLRHVWTDCGKGRALIRAALNERSLERYVLMWLSEPQRLADNYWPSALVRDDEATNLLPSIAAGLSSILFAITIDSPNLNVAPLADRAQRTEPMIVAPLPRVRASVGGGGGGGSGATRRHHKQIISFDDDDGVDEDADVATVAASSASSSVGSETTTTTTMRSKSLASMCLKFDATMPPKQTSSTLVSEELPGTIFISSSAAETSLATSVEQRLSAGGEPDLEDGFSGSGTTSDILIPSSSTSPSPVDVKTGESEMTSRSTSSCSNFSATATATNSANINNNNNNYPDEDGSEEDITVIKQQLRDSLERCKILENQVDELSLYVFVNFLLNNSF